MICSTERCEYLGFQQKEKHVREESKVATLEKKRVFALSRQSDKAKRNDTTQIFNERITESSPRVWLVKSKLKVRQRG